jgi:hypothetical protein
MEAMPRYETVNKGIKKRVLSLGRNKKMKLECVLNVSKMNNSEKGIDL